MIHERAKGKSRPHLCAPERVRHSGAAVRYCPDRAHRCPALRRLDGSAGSPRGELQPVRCPLGPLPIGIAPVGLGALIGSKTKFSNESEIISVT